MGVFPESKILLIIATIIATLSVAGAMAGITADVLGIGAKRADDISTEVAADIRVVNYPWSDGSVYNDSSETLTLYVKNSGSRTLPADPDAIDLLVDGEYVTDFSVTVLDAEAWTPGTVAKIEATVSLSINESHRVVVRTQRAETTFVFDAYNTTPTSSSQPVRDEIVFTTGSGQLKSVATNGTIFTYDATAAAIGPKEIDFDDDGRLEIPYVNGSGSLKLIDQNNETTLLATGADTTNTIVGVGTWRGNTSVFYVNSSDSNTIYRVRPGADPTQVTVGGSSVSANAIAGVGDFNDDGDADLVYAGTSSTVKFLDNDSVQSTGVSVGSNNNVGIGAPREFDGTAPIRTPIVDGSQNVGLLDSDGTKSTLTSGGPASKTAVGGIDWTGGDNLEVIFINSSGNLKYVTVGGTVGTVTDSDGDPITASSDTGVA